MRHHATIKAHKSAHDVRLTTQASSDKKEYRSHFFHWWRPPLAESGSFYLSKVLGLTMRNVPWNRIPIKYLLMISCLPQHMRIGVTWNTTMRKFDSSQKGESRAQSADASKACSKTRVLINWRSSSNVRSTTNRSQWRLRSKPGLRPNQQHTQQLLIFRRTSNWQDTQAAVRTSVSQGKEEAVRSWDTPKKVRYGQHQLSVGDNHRKGRYFVVGLDQWFSNWGVVHHFWRGRE